MKYVATKVLKRLETNKLRGGFKDPQRTLLVPISFGVSSIVLLHVLNQQLSARAEAGRHSGYNLHILFVDESAVLKHAFLPDLLDMLKQRYPSHTYTVVSLEDYCDYDFDFDLPAFADARTNGHGVLDKITRFKRILSSLPSATSRADMIEILRRRLIIAFAQKHACDSILFGDSTTRLAEKTLSETAKGRGISLPWLIADGSPSHGINCTYPLRDLLRKELGAYVSMTLPPLTPLVCEAPSQTPTSSKETTIDGLMTQYFESVEQNYPSIVANVVRTSGKLLAPSILEDIDACTLCGCPIANMSWGGDQLDSAVPRLADGSGSEHGKAICYGCARTV
ncbi:cytoplasmic tRNA 2-thiolation protein 2 [Imshaugia aleurites]|uniref:Cytoplasmic tRNA 2-thiolation protein 2 n=1 Tax=Imshaugia aleurites TaxID=172621 RepID=A0A8H3I7S2_9LECA|nr:cytoplasmic tRNA 2-thiolation protein 2 [Imshaugia aleurites]